MRIMTVNIWGEYTDTDLDRRIEGILAPISIHRPDIIGLQEYTAGWRNSAFPDGLGKLGYTLLARPEGEYPCGDHTALLYKPDKCEPLENGWSVLRGSSDPTHSISWGVFRRRDDGKTFAAASVHFWWMEGNEHDSIRVENAAHTESVMLGLAKKYGCPVFVFGDLNTTVGTPSFEHLIGAGFRDVRAEAVLSDDRCGYHGEPTLGDDGRYHGKVSDQKYTASLDHILGAGDFKAMRFAVFASAQTVDVTDHSPAYCAVDF